MNDIIENGIGKAGYPIIFWKKTHKNNTTINDMALAAEEFINYFGSLGPGLAIAIAKTDNRDYVESKDTWVKESIFIKGTDEK